MKKLIPMAAFLLVLMGVAGIAYRIVRGPAPADDASRLERKAERP
ncbi:MAG TPA: hypothetical protein VGS19_15435 [Streptosporangiaceae bacterium]|nr:hypothetical protein [Streptosporangiaceae bacterium]